VEVGGDTLTGPAGIYDLRLDATGSASAACRSNLLVKDTERWINGAGDSTRKTFDQLDLIEVCRAASHHQSASSLEAR
jgi:hypothetical protein